MLRAALCVLLAAGSACAQARLAVTRDDASSTLLLRAGPVKMPSGAAAQMGPLEFQSPLSGWAVSFGLRVTDEKRGELPGKLLRQAVLETAARDDVLCPKRPERFLNGFTAPSGLPEFPGLGFAMEAGDKLRLAAAVTNGGAQDYDAVYVEITVGFRERGKSTLPVTAVVPLWLDSGGCTAAKATDDVVRQEYTLPVAGKFLAAAGDATRFGKRLLLERLPGSILADLGRQRAGTFALANWMPRAGIPVAAGDRFRLTAEFINPLPSATASNHAAMLLYLLPASKK